MTPSIAELPLAELVATSSAVAATRSRNAKRDLLADLLRRTPVRDVAVAAAYLSGAPRQQRLGVGYRSLPTVPPAAAPTLTLGTLDQEFETIAAEAGKGSSARRSALLAGLFGRATADEQAFLAALLTGTLRQGSLEGPLLAALAVAYEVPEPVLRRGLMFAGRVGPLAQAAAAGGAAAVVALRLEVGRPVRPMLAGSAPSVRAALESLTATAGDGAPAPLVQTKLDGIRCQLHLRRDAPGEPPRVWAFTRSLDDITDRLPEVVELAQSLPATSAVLDGEVLAMGPDGRPRPFQETGARTASQASPQALRATTPLTTYLFDVLHLDGVDLLDAPLHERHEALSALAPAHVVPTLRAPDAEAAEVFAETALAAGHEGVVLKDPATAYAAGRRGSGWIKVKPRRTLDLVVLAVEPGSGRRAGWLSNIHVGARDPATGGFVMVGKTFKGMTDEMLRWQTARFTELQVAAEGYVVRVRPEQVVEIALDGVQASRRYPGGVALRFARVIRYRDDKAPAEADTIEAVRALLPGPTAASTAPG